MKNSSKKLIVALLVTFFVGISHAAVTITTPVVNSGELIRAADWNKMRADLVNLAATLDLTGNLSWLTGAAGKLYYENGKVGVGTATPSAQLGVYKESPSENESLFQIGTGADADRVNIDEDGDMTIDGTMLVRGGNIYDSSGSIELNGEDNTYIGIDWNDNDLDTRAFIVGKNAPGPGGNWAELMRVGEDGNVGIGTTNPIAQLHLDGSGTQLKIENSGGSAYMEFINSASTGTGEYIGSWGDKLTFWISNDPKMVIDESGKVGIGTNTPSAQLHLDGSGTQIKVESSGGSAYMEFINSASTGTGEYVGSWGDKLTFWTSNDPKMVIDGTGNVGIGDNTPSAKLDVAGTIRAEQICDETGANCQDISTGWAAGSADNLGNHTATQALVMSGNAITGSNFNIAGVNELKINDPGEGINFHDNGGMYMVDDATDDKLYIDAGAVGINTTDPKARLHVNDGSDASLSSTGHGLTIGSHTGQNIAIDSNEIMARNNGAASSLYLNNDGGKVETGGNLVVGGTATVSAPTASSHAVTKGFLESCSICIDCDPNGGATNGTAQCVAANGSWSAFTGDLSANGSPGDDNVRCRIKFDC